jgi:hypothetical protein
MGNIGRKGELGVMADEAPCIIAIMGNQRAWPLEARANARLIAAAPELLAALIELERAESSPHSETLRFLAREQAREAIAKATGEEVQG